MNGKCLALSLMMILSLVFFFIIPGCVEVTPPSGQNEASAYGPATTGGDMKDLVKGQGQQTTGPTSAGGQETSSGSVSTETPNASIPEAPNTSFVRVTPRSYDELRPDTQTSYLQYNRPVSTEERQYISIYEISHQGFAKNVTAYAYDLKTPPLYIEMGFYPKMVTDELEVYKRTGDKEGTITYSKTRPSQDAWFELRVYDLDSGEEILNEGYGKTYSLTNKTTAIRRAGSFQFDFMGDAIAADITMKIPVSSSVLETYSDVSDLLTSKKTESGLIPHIFLEASDLGQGWQQSGDLIHTTDRYSSMYLLPATGSKITQEIRRYSGTSEAGTGYTQTKTKNAGENQVSIMAGDEGYGFESNWKTGIVFRQGPYLVELTSYSVPPVSFSDLQRYASMISGRINQV